jgi:hypothetical protein
VRASRPLWTLSRAMSTSCGGAVLARRLRRLLRPILRGADPSREDPEEDVDPEETRRGGNSTDDGSRGDSSLYCTGGVFSLGFIGGVGCRYNAGGVGSLYVVRGY